MSIVRDFRLPSSSVDRDSNQPSASDDGANIGSDAAGAVRASRLRLVEDAVDPKVIYEMYCDRLGRWHVRRGDGGVAGVFAQRRDAVRFVWCKCHDAKRLIVIEDKHDDRPAAEDTKIES